MKLTSGIETLRLANGAQPPQPNKIYLHPGQTHVTAVPSKITTIVGSCVAVMLWDSRFRIGGVTHYLLPSWDGHGQASARYGDVALEGLLSEITKAGARPPDMRAYVYGGGSVLTALQAQAGALGGRNVERAFEWLKSNPAIVLMDQHTGGNRGKKIIFDTLEGKAIWHEI
jgi:chemotaxis protein CheD